MIQLQSSRYFCRSYVDSCSSNLSYRNSKAGYGSLVPTIEADLKKEGDRASVSNN